MSKLILYGAGIMMLVVGALHLFAPQMMKEAGIDLTSPNHFHVIRAAYGGAYLGISALFLLGAFRAHYQRSSLLAVAILFSGFAFGRLISILFDGKPATLYLGVLTAEVVFAVLAIVSLRSMARG